LTGVEEPLDELRIGLGEIDVLATLTAATYDGEIVRRIRERRPDSRFDDSSDAELLQLFERNKRVLSRSDENAIAAMTHLK
jgi:hypothetical protein